MRCSKPRPEVQISKLMGIKLVYPELGGDFRVKKSNRNNLGEVVKYIEYPQDRNAS